LGKKKKPPFSSDSVFNAVSLVQEKDGENTLPKSSNKNKIKIITKKSVEKLD